MLSLIGILWLVSHDHIAGSGLGLIEVACFFEVDRRPDTTKVPLALFYWPSQVKLIFSCTIAASPRTKEPSGAQATSVVCYLMNHVTFPCTAVHLDARINLGSSLVFLVNLPGISPPFSSSC